KQTNSLPRQDVRDCLTLSLETVTPILELGLYGAVLLPGAPTEPLVRYVIEGHHPLMDCAVGTPRHMTFAIVYRAVRLNAESLGYDVGILRARNKYKPQEHSALVLGVLVHSSPLFIRAHLRHLRTHVRSSLWFLWTCSYVCFG